MVCRRDYIQECAAGTHHPAKLLQGQGRKAVQQHIRRTVRQRQMEGGGHSKFQALFPPGGVAEDGLGDVGARHAGPPARRRQGLIDPGGVVALPAAGVQNGRLGAGTGQNLITKGIQQGGIIPFGEEFPPGGGHTLVVAGGSGVLLIGGQQVGVALPGDVEAVPVGAAVDVFFPGQRLTADGAAEQAHDASLRVTSLIHLRLRRRWMPQGILHRFSE